MHMRVLVCSTQYPGRGGGASVAYDYHKKQLDEGIESSLYFFLVVVFLVVLFVVVFVVSFVVVLFVVCSRGLFLNF